MSLQFNEEQKFTQYWIFIPLIFMGIIPIVGLYQQMVAGVPFGSHPMSNWGLALVLVFELGLLGMFWFARLCTEINDSGIKITFLPFTKKQFQWDEIKTATVVNYGFVGGWGVRMFTKYGTVYNTSGKMGLAIELNNGKKYCVGTQKEGELKQVIAEAYRMRRIMATPVDNA